MQLVRFHSPLLDDGSHAPSPASPSGAVGGVPESDPHCGICGGRPHSGAGEEGMLCSYSEQLCLHAGVCVCLCVVCSHLFVNNG
jgi:hypothetical protein